MKNITIIGGGTGTYTLLSGLKKYPVNLSVVVSTADDGGSTGILRRELGVVPPGDIRQCLLGLSFAHQKTKDLFGFRFSEGELSGHVAGNIIISALEQIQGNIKDAVQTCAKILKVKGRVLPVTLKSTTLVAKYANGKTVVGEHNIDEPKSDLRFKIEDLRLEPKTHSNPDVIRAIKEADVLVFGPGDLYTSILPNLLAAGVVKAIKNSKAKKVYVTNLMTKYGQTDHFKTSDFVEEMLKYLRGAHLNFVVVNDQKPSQEWLKRYHKEQGEFVWPDISKIKEKGIEVVADNFLADYIFQNQPGDKLRRSLLRHNSDKLAKTIYNLRFKI